MFALAAGPDSGSNGGAWKSQLIPQRGQASLAGVPAPPPATPLPKPCTGHEHMALGAEGQQAAQTGQPFTEQTQPDRKSVV